MALEQPVDLTPDPAPESSAEPAPKKSARGPLLDKPPEDAAKLADDLWRLDERTFRRLSVQWEANKARRQGLRDVHVIKDNDNQQGYRIYIPLVNTGTAPVPNKTDELGRRVIATLLVDEPKPDVLPASDTTEDVDAAEFASRVLETENGSGAINQRGIMEGALDLAYTFASGFTRTWTDPYGGGQQPIQMLCHPQATTAQEAETGPAGSQPSSDMVLKYVGMDGTLSDTAANAKKQWKPQIVKELLTGNHIRFLPRKVRGIEDAKGVIITRPTTFGQLRALYEDVDGMSPDEQWEIVNWRPHRYRDLLMDSEEMRPKQATLDTPDDHELCFIREVFYIPTREYPEGCHVCFAANKYRLHGDVWTLTSMDKDGNVVTDTRELPVAQYRWMPDHQKGNPYGIAGAETVGPLDEIRGFLNAGIMEAVFKALNPNIAFPMGTTIQPEQWGRRDGTPLMYNAAAGTPWTEDAPNLPQYVTEYMQLVDHWMDTASGLEEAAKGVNTPNVRSDAQAQTIIEQALVALASVRHSIEDGFERDCRLTMQEMKQNFRAPQMIRYLGPDGAFKYNAWSGADLTGMTDVRVRKGTFTMMAPSARAQYIDQLTQMGAIPLDEAVRLKRGAIDWLTGQEDDRFYQRIKRQIDTWTKGPSDEVKAQSDQMKLEPPQVDPMTGQPIPVPDPMVQAAQQVFTPLPVDEEQAVAMVRHKELAMFMSTTRFAEFPDPWKQGYFMAYQQARQAAGIATVQEQQQAQQQAQQAQTEQMQQQAQIQQQIDQQKLQAEQARTELDMKKAQQDDQLASVKHDRDMMKMQMQPLVAANQQKGETGAVQK